MMMLVCVCVMANWIKRAPITSSQLCRLVWCRLLRLAGAASSVELSPRQRRRFHANLAPSQPLLVYLDRYLSIVFHACSSSLSCLLSP